MPRQKSTKNDAGSDYEEPLSKPDIKGKRKKRKIDVGKDGQHAKSKALLQSMVDMPVDVLLEVFKHLELVDLWHLSQTSKPIRSILMSRSSISVWKQAIANDGLPQCTKDLTEPRLAGLIFGRSCDWCGRNVSGQEIIWAARVRACKRCIEHTYEQHNGCNQKYPCELAVHVPSVVVKQKRYMDGDLDREWLQECQSKQSEDELSEWLNARVAERRVITKHAKACQMWFESRRKNQVMVRKAMIIERLKDMGWEEELNKLTTGAKPTDLIEVVKACQSELTEPILARLDGVLIEFMVQTKSTRLDREKEEFFRHMLERLGEISREYSLTLPPDQIFPNTADIYFHPTIKKALSAVGSHQVLEEALTRIQPSIPEIVGDCLKLSKQALTKLVIDEYTMNNKSFDRSVLTFAATLFYCKCCRRDLTLDQAVAHRCQGLYISIDDPDAKAVQSAIKEVSTVYRIGNKISFSLASLRSFVSVLHSCGIDPNMTTTAEMNGIDPILECLDCSNADNGRVTMRWFTVPRHLRSIRHPTSGMSILDEPEAEFVRGRMLEQYQRETARSKDHICAHCRDSGGSMTLMQHVKRCHYIDSPVYGQDVIVSPKAVTTCHEFYLWPPKL